MAILSSKEKKLVLSDIYQWILDNYPYFRRRGPGWRNSIRHNLSLNDCFVKSGRSANGKGHYWAIHPANTEDFTKGDFRRRRAQRKVRKAMGLSVPDEEDSPSPSPTPPCGTAGAVAAVVAMQDWQSRMFGLRPQDAVPAPAMMELLAQFDTNRRGEETKNPVVHRNPPESGEIFRLDDDDNIAGTRKTRDVVPAKKRLFDVESLLAPDTPKPFTINHRDDVIVRKTENRNEQSPGFRVSSSGRTYNTRFDGRLKNIIHTPSKPTNVIRDVMSTSNNDVDFDDDEIGVEVEEVKYDSSDEVEEELNVNDRGRERTVNNEKVSGTKDEHVEVDCETLGDSIYRVQHTSKGRVEDGDSSLTTSGGTVRPIKYSTTDLNQDVERDLNPTARASQELRDISRDFTRQQFLRDYSRITPHQLDWRAVFQQSRFHLPSPFNHSTRPSGCNAGPSSQASAWVGGLLGRQGRYSPLQRSQAVTGHTLRPGVYSRVKSSDVIRSPDNKYSSSDVTRSPDYKHCSDVEENEREEKIYLPKTIKMETS